MMTNIIARLTEHLSPQQVRADVETVALCCRDYKGYNIGRALAVVFPDTVSDVEHIISTCRDEQIKIVPQGGNTSGYGGAVPDQSGDSIILKMSRMNRIEDIDLSNNTVTVEAGVVLGDLNRKLAEQKKFFPISFGSEDSCQIGGNLAMNAGGSTVIRFGMMRENVLGMEAVLGNGTTFSNLRPLHKKCVGYDLGQVLLGSEGTLGVMTRAVLKLQPLPTDTVTAWMACGSLDDAIGTLDVLRNSLAGRMVAFEVISRQQREIIAQYSFQLIDPISEPYAWAILAEFTEMAERSHLKEAVEVALAQALELDLISDALIAASLAQRKHFWHVRDSVLDANKAFGWTVSHDSSVPVSRLPEFARQVESEVIRAFPAARFIAAGHAGDGNIHLGVVFEKRAFNNLPAFREITLCINHMVFDIAYSLGGHFASEHGIGVQHVEAFRRYMPKGNLDLMRAAKTIFDPQNIMNPGKIFT